MIRLPKEIEGEKTLLSFFTKSDINPEYLSWLNDKSLMKYSNQRFQFHTQKTSEAYLRTFDFDKSYFYSVKELKTGKSVGSVTIYYDENHQRADIGIMIGAYPLQGRGLGYDAFKTAVKQLSKEKNVRKITAGASEKNQTMKAIFEKCGMQYECKRSGHELIDGNPSDLVYYAKFP